MSSPDSTAPSLPLSTKENITPISSKIEELNESRSELLGRIQSLKQDLQGWRSKLDTQVKVYRDIVGFELGRQGAVPSGKAEVKPLQYGEPRGGRVKCNGISELTDLKKTLNVEVEQLRVEFQDLRTTLQQQQEDVTTSLRNLGLQDVSGDVKQAQSQETKTEEIAKEEQPVLHLHEDENTKIAEN
ncbi:hypothetical protein L195_g014854 [Trifolium pratense]|uniref:Uncharacterized protein n=1 Tax=Trifolium pratense TaxID=57577 RepID=A0A2K3PS50_TRIPR|nr:hypothetical protein L195_g014854 [Trifolium pratense]